MGNICKLVPQDPDEFRNYTIEQELKKEKNSKKPTLLMLGPGESGKSTILKQMKIMAEGGTDGGGFTEAERDVYKPIICNQIIQDIQTLIKGAEAISIKLDQKCKDLAPSLTKINETNFREQIESIQYIWHNKGIQEALSHYRDMSLKGFSIADSTRYYLNDLDRILDPSTHLKDEDVLRSRVKTSALVQYEYLYKAISIRMLDVGGQKSERRKWLHAMCDVLEAIIFCVPLSDYDINLREDYSENRMQDAINLFQNICAHKAVKSINIVLFLNKDDLFKEKIKTVDPKLTFPDYNGGCNYDKALAYFKDKFFKIFNDTTEKNSNVRKIFSFVTIATDTEIMSPVMRSVRDNVLRKSVNASFGIPQ